MGWGAQIVGGIHGTGASPEHGQCAMEAQAGAALKDFSKLFATVDLAVKAVNAVKSAAVGRPGFNNDSFMDPLLTLAALFDRVQAAQLELAKMFLESAAAQKKLGHPPSRSTVNLRHFTICATVTPPPPPNVLGPLREPCRCAPATHHSAPYFGKSICLYIGLTVLCVACAGRRLSVYICGSLCCALHVQESAALATDLYASLTRPAARRLLFRGTLRVSHEEAGRRLSADTMRVKTYFSALLIEAGLPVTAWGPGG